MLRRLALAIAVVALPACLTLRGAAGPVMTPDGDTGMDATIALGAGDGLGDQRAWFVASKFGFGLNPLGPEPGLVMQAAVDYVSEKGAGKRGDGFAWRAGGRLGARLLFVDEEETIGYNTVGAAVAVFPFNWANTGGGGESHEKMGDLFGMDDVDGFYNLGIELSAERMFSVEAAGAWLFSLQVVFDMNTFD